MSKKYVGVQFLNSIDGQGRKTDLFTYSNDLGAKLFDIVVVSTRYGKSFGVVKSEMKESDIDADITKGVLEIVKSKVLTEHFREEKACHLERQLKEKLNRNKAYKLLEEMSKDDEECAAMLKEIKTLRGIK